ncbi:MAG: hypothetical protein HDT16_02060 [Oscillibacter sp.]|nr:hypothetical protein [Oscillibacter sp.]
MFWKSYFLYFCTEMKRSISGKPKYTKSGKFATKTKIKIAKKPTQEDELLMVSREKEHSQKVRAKYNAFEEASLSQIDRLGLAFCRLNCWEWDDIVGPKPEGFDDLRISDRFSVERYRHPFLMWVLEKIDPDTYQRGRYKFDYTHPAIEAITSVIGEANTSRCWWKFELRRTETEWWNWYCTEKFLRDRDY